MSDPTGPADADDLLFVEEVPSGEPTDPRAAPDPILGAVLGGQYRIEAVIGAGGTGRVYLATQESLDRAVALKVMLPELDPEGQQRFEERFFREASLAGALQHPNVVTVHDFGRADDGSCYIVMELLGGTDLKAEMRRGPMALDRALSIFEQILRGLRSAHRCGLVHRDVKPGNIQLVPGEDGRDFVKILDFGLVKMLHGERPGKAPLALDPLEEKSEITQAGTFLGTPHYASPEQGRGAEADARSDLYSVGVMLYRALTGKLPYTAATPMQIAVAHNREPFPPMRERAPEVAVPPPIEAVVRRAMEKEPERRFQDADEMLAALLQAGRAVGVEGETLAGPVAVEEPRDPERPMARWALAVFGTVLLLVAAITWLGWQLRPNEPPAVALAPPPPPVAAPVEEPDAREVYVLVSSEPAGAEVVLDGAVLGTTPLARKLTVRADEAEPKRSFRLHLDGYRDQELILDLSEDQATGNAVLERIARPKAKAAAKSGDSPIVADGVTFTAGEAKAAVAFLNAATRERLLTAGVAPQQAKIVLDHRPWTDVQSFAARPYIGPKTVEAVRNAVR